MIYRTTLGAPVFGLRREIDRLFEDTFGRDGNNGLSPSVDVRESARELTFDIELPGVRPEDVELTAEKGVLTIRGEKRAGQKEEDETRYHVLERSFGTFSRSFQLPQGVQDDQIEAGFENGMLTVRVPKAPAQQPRKIAINHGTNGQQRVSAGA